MCELDDLNCQGRVLPLDSLLRCSPDRLGEVAEQVLVRSRRLGRPDRLSDGAIFAEIFERPVESMGLNAVRLTVNVLRTGHYAELILLYVHTKLDVRALVAAYAEARLLGAHGQDVATKNSRERVLGDLAGRIAQDHREL